MPREEDPAHDGDWTWHSWWLFALAAAAFAVATSRALLQGRGPQAVAVGALVSMAYGAAAVLLLRRPLVGHIVASCILVATCAGFWIYELVRAGPARPWGLACALLLVLYDLVRWALLGRASWQGGGRGDQAARDAYLLGLETTDLASGSGARHTQDAHPGPWTACGREPCAAERAEVDALRAAADGADRDSGGA